MWKLVSPLNELTNQSINNQSIKFHAELTIKKDSTRTKQHNPRYYNYYDIKDNQQTNLVSIIVIITVYTANCHQSQANYCNIYHNAVQSYLDCLTTVDFSSKYSDR